MGSTGIPSLNGCLAPTLLQVRALGARRIDNRIDCAEAGRQRHGHRAEPLPRPNPGGRLALAAALWLSPALCDGLLPAQQPQPTLPAEETLTYVISWPSGLGVGNAEFRARYTDPGWRLQATLRASLPELEIDDAFVSLADDDLCSIEFEKHARHGAKRSHESLRFGPTTVRRINLAGRAGDPAGVEPAAACSRDALAFLYHLRRDLAAGRMPSGADIFFGARYRLQLRYAQTRTVVVNGQRRIADELLASVRGPASEHSFSMHFGRDEARTPLLFQVEAANTRFTMQLLEDAAEDLR